MGHLPAEYYTNDPVPWTINGFFFIVTEDDAVTAGYPTTLEPYFDFPPDIIKKFSSPTV